MTIGLTRALSEFMDIMNRVCWIYLDSFVFVFIDDILAYLENEGDRMDHLRVVLQLLKEHQLFSTYRKCEFLFRSVEFLGNIISN